jgi:peptidoglycan hydrolase CwlO-like protein
MNKLNRKQQKRLLEFVVLLALLLLVITLSHIQLVSKNNELEKQINTLTQENSNIKNELEKSNSEIKSLEWKLEEYEKKQETHKMTK